MANKSPSIQIIEKDMSTYTVTSSGTVLAVVGYASKGPIGEVTLVTSLQEFLDEFGPAPVDSPFANLAVRKAFNQGNQILFYRIADESSSEQATAAEYGVLNATTATSGYDEFGLTVTGSDASGLGGNQKFDIDVNIDGSGSQTFEVVTTSYSPTYAQLVSLFDTTISASGATVSIEGTAPNQDIRVTSDSTGTSSTILLAATGGGSGTAEVTDISFTDNSGSSNADYSGEYITFYVLEDGVEATHVFWFDVDDGSTAPTVSNATMHEIDILSTDDGVAVAGKAHTIIDAVTGLGSLDNGGTTNGSLTITHTPVGAMTDATESTGGAPISLVVSTPGVNADLTDGLTGFTAFEGTTAGTDADPSGTDSIYFVAKEKGSATNNISVQKTSYTNPIDGTTVHRLEVFYDGVSKEVFDDVSLTIADSNFIATVVNASVDNGGSEWISIQYDDTDTSDDLTLPDNASGEFYTLGSGTVEFDSGTHTAYDGIYDYVVGTDGIPSNEGNEANLFVSALATTADLANMDEYDYHIMITPDLAGNVVVQDAAIALADYRKDFIYLVDPPFGLKYDEVADWHNGNGSGRTSALNDSYAALYWAWLKMYNSDATEYTWVPPSVFLAAKYMEVDRLYGPWYAPAGDTRGRLDASDYEKSPSFPQREILYGDLNAVNPIVNFTGKGLLIYGQKTLLRENSALNRVNVRRMVIYIKKLIKQAMESMVFEPHNADSWRRATGMITSILEPVRQANGIDQYKVVIDSTTNTPEVISQNIMKGTIKIIPVNTIEIIELTLQVHKAGASLDE